jgi:hypothetical protein
VRVNLHSRSDLAAKVQNNLVAFLEAGFNLYDIPIVSPDHDVPELYHVSFENCDLRFGRNNKIAGLRTPIVERRRTQSQP